MKGENFQSTRFVFLRWRCLSNQALSTEETSFFVSSSRVRIPCESSSRDQAGESSRIWWRSIKLWRGSSRDPQNPRKSTDTWAEVFVIFGAQPKIQLDLFSARKAMEFSHLHRALGATFSFKNLKVKDRPSNTNCTFLSKLSTVLKGTSLTYLIEVNAPIKWTEPVSLVVTLHLKLKHVKSKLHFEKRPRVSLRRHWWLFFSVYSKLWRAIRKIKN